MTISVSLGSGWESGEWARQVFGTYSAPPPLGPQGELTGLEGLALLWRLSLGCPEIPHLPIPPLGTKSHDFAKLGFIHFFIHSFIPTL